MMDLFSCIDCGFNTFQSEYYMVKNDIWPIPVNGGMLCIGCLEERIGRKLNSKDFLDCPLNCLDSYLDKFLRSERLIDRLTNNE